jgi:Uncharacterized conserved protein (COG2071)
MTIPVLHGTIDRRILINYRVDPEVAARRLPAPFRPQIVGGAALGGVCLIRLKGIRPRLLPAIAGLSSESAAHRFAVEWDDADGPRRGVYIPRRDTSSWINRAVGGRLFPGVYRRARFAIDERDGEYRLEMNSSDGEVHVQIAARDAIEMAGGSVFRTMDEARRFFEEGCVGCSDTRERGAFDAIELRCSVFRLTPLEVEQVGSSFFDDRRLFPEGSVAFDSAFLMHGIEHTWHDGGRVRAA